MLTKLLCVLPFLLMDVVSAQVVDTDPAHKTNGCGTGGWGLLVPNKTMISSCNFLPACDEHDICYGKCLKGGPLSGPTCKDESERMARKKICDVRLREDINFFNKNRKICGVYALIYEWAVSKFGKDAFYGATAQAGSAASISDFLAYVDSNPESFNLEEVDKVFKKVNAENEKYTYFVKFDAYAPQLEIIIFNDVNKIVEVISLKGRANAN